MRISFSIFDGNVWFNCGSWGGNPRKFGITILTYDIPEKSFIPLAIYFDKFEISISIYVP